MLVLVEVTDLIFAVDSIPAIFGVTRDPFLVFTSNIFAMLGLRSLYFLLASVVDEVLPAQVRARRDPDVRRREDARRALVPHPHPARRSASCSGVLALSIVASLIWSRRESRARGGDATSGSIFGTRRSTIDRRTLSAVRPRRARRAGSRSTAARDDRRSRASPSATSSPVALARSNASRYISSRLARMRSRERDMRIFSRA